MQADRGLENVYWRLIVPSSAHSLNDKRWLLKVLLSSKYRQGVNSVLLLHPR